MNRKEALRQARQAETLQSLGFTADEAESLRRISMTLRRWFECECNGTIERDDATNKPYHRIQYEGMNGWVDKRFSIPDRETGARKRLASIMADKVGLSTYIQSDPRGAALYILRPGDVPEGEDAGSYYSRGICVY